MVLVSPLPAAVGPFGVGWTQENDTWQMTEGGIYGIRHKHTSSGFCTLHCGNKACMQPPCRNRGCLCCKPMKLRNKSGILPGLDRADQCFFASDDPY